VCARPLAKKSVMRLSRWFLCAVATGALVFTTLSTSGRTVASPPLFVGMGDSIGEAVQSTDANEYTQPTSYLNFIAWRGGASFPLPLIKTNPAGFIESVKGRTRIHPTVEGLNLAVSGANAHSILYDYATATDVSQISDETEMVLFPRTGSQIQIAESLRAACSASTACTRRRSPTPCWRTCSSTSSTRTTA
jgi:hypothetical protein